MCGLKIPDEKWSKGDARERVGQMKPLGRSGKWVAQKWVNVCFNDHVG